MTSVSALTASSNPFSVSAARVRREQGVSHDDLVEALADGMPADTPAGVDKTAMAEQIASQQGMQAPGGHGGPPPPPPASGLMMGTVTSAQQSLLDSLASLLDTDSGSLATSLQSGTSPAELLSQKGVSVSSLAGVLQSGLLVNTYA